jgi:acyl-coenzyme A synthetase/AMP-(fatty) acid ligase
MISDQALTDVPTIGDTIKITKTFLNGSSGVPSGRVIIGTLKSLAIGYEIKVFGDKDHYEGKYDGEVVLTTTPVMAMRIDKDGAVYAKTFTSTYKLELVNSKYQQAMDEREASYSRQIQRAFGELLRS